ncbi:Ubiquitinyl hydrolase 1 [Bertholletia excelsa]
MGSRKTDIMEGRDEPPSGHSVKIESFSSLQKAGIEKYSSEAFEAEGYKWKLLIYPNGYKSRGEGHISMVLSLEETSSLPVDWEVNTVFNFFILDRIHNKYVTFSGSSCLRICRFHATKSEWGVAKFIDLETFTDPLYGYLVDDTCVFGVELFVIKQPSKGEQLSVLKEAATGKDAWKIRSFSCLTLGWYESDAFTVGDYKWKIRLYPKGNGAGKGNSISVFLRLVDSTLPPDAKLLVTYAIRVLKMDQTEEQPENFKLTAENKFGASNLTWGYQKFMSLATFNDPEMMFLVDDSCIIQAQVTLIGTVSPAS